MKDTQRTMYDDGFSTEAIASALRILGFKPNAPTDEDRRRWREDMANAPLLPECIAKGQHLSGETCDICLNHDYGKSFIEIIP